ncbi:hypothetical protein [Mycoplasma suis]|uniref:Uncharacterized protein n=1 Tax=Mycoplasma suis (strain Illinois) TaxID=768700 RepID=F0QQI1_MYCSL|nr:hypothetical protein [Mycoplasma suis]ADX97751.1 hypothetical protein MSU_0207 [Mycoplasma suis str. Illinois]
MLNGFFTKKLITSVIGIAGLAGGGGIGLTSLLMGGKNFLPEQVDTRNPSSVIPNKVNERLTMEEVDYEGAKTKNILVAEYIFVDKNSSTEDKKQICEYWVSAPSSWAVKKEIPEEKCKKLVEEFIRKEDDRNKSYKWISVKQQYLQNVFSSYFSFYKKNNNDLQSYLLQDQWSFDDGWSCKLTTEEQLEKINCSRLESRK